MSWADRDRRGPGDSDEQLRRKEQARAEALALFEQVTAEAELQRQSEMRPTEAEMLRYQQWLQSEQGRSYAAWEARANHLLDLADRMDEALAGRLRQAARRDLAELERRTAATAVDVGRMKPRYRIGRFLAVPLVWAAVMLCLVLLDDTLAWVAASAVLLGVSIVFAIWASRHRIRTVDARHADELDQTLDDVTSRWRAEVVPRHGFDPTQTYSLISDRSGDVRIRIAMRSATRTLPAPDDLPTLGYTLRTYGKEFGLLSRISRAVAAKTPVLDEHAAGSTLIETITSAP